MFLEIPNMRASILIIFILFLHLKSFSQLNIPKFKDTTDISKFPKDSLLAKVINESITSVVFSRYSAFTVYKEYSIINYGTDKNWHYNIITRDGDTYLLLNISISQDSIKKLWETIKTNDLFTIQKEWQFDENCDANIFDSHHYLFWLFAYNQYRKVHYYDPEHFEANCESNPERRKIIICANKFLALRKITQ